MKRAQLFFFLRSNVNLGNCHSFFKNPFPRVLSYSLSRLQQSSLKGGTEIFWRNYELARITEQNLHLHYMTAYLPVWPTYAHFIEIESPHRKEPYLQIFIKLWVWEPTFFLKWFFLFFLLFSFKMLYDSSQDLDLFCNPLQAFSFNLFSYLIFLFSFIFFFCIFFFCFFFFGKPTTKIWHK